MIKQQPIVRLKIGIMTMLLILSLLPLSVWAQTCRNDIPLLAPDNRYTDLGDGSVKDLHTGLQWMRCSLGQTWNGTTCNGSVTTQTWQGALIAAENHDFANQTDWRLPNIKELNSIVDSSCYNLSINQNIFPSAVNSDYWSATHGSENVNYAWYVNFGNGVVDLNLKNDDFNVRLVRAGQSSAIGDTNDLVNVSLNQLADKILVFSEPGIDLAVKFKADGYVESIIFESGEMVYDLLPGEWSVTASSINLNIYDLGEVNIAVGADGKIDRNEVVQFDGSPLTVSDIIKPYSTPFLSISGHKVTVYHDNFTAATSYQFNDDNTLLLSDLSSPNSSPTEGIWRYFNSNTWIQYSFDNGVNWKEFTSHVGGDFDFRRRIDGDFNGNVVKVEPIANVETAKTDVHFVSENLPDYTFVAGDINKQWRLKNTDTAYSGVKAIVTAASVGTGLTVNQEVLVGDISANSDFVVNIQTTIASIGTPIKSAEFELRDSSNNIIEISNSANNKFWFKVRTNRPPQFAVGQLFDMAGAANTLLSLPLYGHDADGDAPSFTITNGIGAIVNNQLQITVTDGLSEHTVTVAISDGKEQVTRDFIVRTFTAQSILSFYDDVDINTANVDAIVYATLQGLLIGSSENGSSRQFKPLEQPTWPEVLKMILGAISQRGDVTIAQSDLLDAPGIAIHWVDTYYTTARQLGMVGASLSLNETPTNEDIARLLVKSLKLDKKASALANSPALANFDAPFCETELEINCFSSNITRHYAQLTKLFGLFMQDLTADPQGLVSRGALAEVMTRILQLPKFDLSLDVTDNKINIGTNANLSVKNLLAPLTSINGSYIMSASEQPAASTHTQIKQVYIGSTPQIDSPISMLDFSTLNIETSKLQTGTHIITVAIENTDNATVGYQQFNFEVLFLDSDSDGLDDTYEVVHGLDPFIDDASQDLDGDTLTNLEEFKLGTAPSLADSDGDGINDGGDAFPLITIGNLLDSDNDGAPNKCDADCLTLGMTADADDDNDGIADVDDPFPLNPNTLPSSPVITSIETEDGALLVSFTPNGDGGSSIIDYTVSCGTSSVTSAQSPIRIEELENDVTYACFVTARNTLGNSLASVIVNATPEGIIRSRLNIPLLKAILDAQAQPQ
jgi:hypothetical protein